MNKVSKYIPTYLPTYPAIRENLSPDLALATTAALLISPLAGASRKSVFVQLPFHQRMKRARAICILKKN